MTQCGNCTNLIELSVQRKANEMDTILIIVCVMLVLFGVWASIPKSGRRTVNHSVQQTEKHETFTNEEILLPGVDIRRKNARRQIEVSRWAQANGATPAHLYDAVQEQMARNRRGVFADPDEVVDGEVVQEIEAPKRKFLGSG